jgi:hypothetical protein
MHALWRLLLRLKRLRLLALVTGLPIIGIGAYLVQYAAKLALDQQLTDVFKAESPNWFKFTLVAVAACAIGWILGFLGGRASSRWLERRAAGVRFEVPTMGSTTHFRFRNMRARRPLGGELLAYDLAFKVHALYNLRNVRLEIVVSDNTGRKVGCFTDPDFSGDVSRGFSTEIVVSTLEIEYLSVVSDPAGSPPHVVMSGPKFKVFNQLVGGATAFSQYEIQLTAFHLSGPDQARLKLEIFDTLCAPYPPATVRLLSGPIEMIPGAAGARGAQ